MPIYEFYSPDLQKIYSFFSHKVRLSDEIPRCPDGEQLSMQKLISGFSITGTKQSEIQESSQVDNSETDPFAGLEPNKAQHLMQEMEKSISSIDDENPDPKQMGHLMRKMCEVSGERIDDRMEEVVRKLEEGKDPNEIEQDMEEYLSDESVDSNEKNAESARKSSNQKKMTRDEKLYQFEEYLRS
jgi:hypothetical protein